MIPVFFLFPEIETCIDTEGAKGIGYRQTGLAIVVGVEHDGSTNEILGIVVHNAGTSYQVEIDVFDPTFVVEVIVVYL